FGLQNRISCATGSAGQSLTFGSLNPSVRFEFWRFFAGAGYSPVAFLNTDKKGILGLHPYRGASSYFVEGGAIWRVVPEFQIIASGALEVGNGSFDASPSPIMEYSIRFRFPLDPRESSGSKGSRFDGYRYPFGIMK
ncbi:MAG: hypothetical protein EBX52_08780, partial [Proteobacteria bacterium]|nr:hypothetical protein [Pseudomonadota bacterium]